MISKTPWSSKAMVGGTHLETDGYLVKDAEGRPIADATCSPDADRKDNARLMAAAGDLLDACVAVEKYLNHLEAEGIGTAGGLAGNVLDAQLQAIRERIHAPLHAKLRPAIEKATGAKGLCPKCRHVPHTPGACGCECHPPGSPGSYPAESSSKKEE